MKTLGIVMAKSKSTRCSDINIVMICHLGIAIALTIHSFDLARFIRSVDSQWLVTSAGKKGAIGSVERREYGNLVKHRFPGVETIHIEGVFGEYQTCEI